MRLKELEGELQPLLGFAAPKRELEQYVTSAHLASRMIFTASESFEDIDDKDVLDLGCGAGILGIASVLCGANSVLAVDIDPDALEIARGNIATMEMEDEITLLNARVCSPSSLPGSVGGRTSAPETPEKGEVSLFDPSSLDRKFDTVVLNPPFGTMVKGIDMVFLEVATLIAETAVYSLHKTSTREHILKKATSLGFKGQVLAEMRYDLPKTYAHHKAKTVDIQVDLFRFSRIVPRPSSAL